MTEQFKEKSHQTDILLPFQPELIPSNGEQLLAAIKRKNIPNINLPADENGYAFIDKEKYPELYAWATEEE